MSEHSFNRKEIGQINPRTGELYEKRRGLGQRIMGMLRRNKADNVVHLDDHRPPEPTTEAQPVNAPIAEGSVGPALDEGTDLRNIVAIRRGEHAQPNEPAAAGQTPEEQIAAQEQDLRRLRRQAGSRYARQRPRPGSDSGSDHAINQ